jgi:hypothetical protein
LLAIRLMTGSKKGISAHQLHRMLGVTYRSAWFMAHRIRLAMDDSAPSALGGEGKFVEADETYIGGKARNRKGKTPKKVAVFSILLHGSAGLTFGARVAWRIRPSESGTSRRLVRITAGP